MLGISLDSMTFTSQLELFRKYFIFTLHDHPLLNFSILVVPLSLPGAMALWTMRVTNKPGGHDINYPSAKEGVLFTPIPQISAKIDGHLNRFAFLAAILYNTDTVPKDCNSYPILLKCNYQKPYLALNKDRYNFI